MRVIAAGAEDGAATPASSVRTTASTAGRDNPLSAPRPAPAQPAAAAATISSVAAARAVLVRLLILLLVLLVVIGCVGGWSGRAVYMPPGAMGPNAALVRVSA